MYILLDYILQLLLRPAKGKGQLWLAEAKAALGFFPPMLQKHPIIPLKYLDDPPSHLYDT